MAGSVGPDRLLTARAAARFDADQPRSPADSPRRGLGSLDRVALGLASWRTGSYRIGMCRSIKTLRRAETAATTGELEAAARQYVRKISGYRTPSARNQAEFDAAIESVAASSRRLMEALGVAVQDGPDPMDRPRVPSGGTAAG